MYCDLIEISYDRQRRGSYKSYLAFYELAALIVVAVLSVRTIKLCNALTI